MPKLNAKVKTKWQGLKPRPDKFFGFIYRIINTVTGKMYIGKKQYHRLNPRRTRKRPLCDTSSELWQPQHWLPSDWEYYKGSCKHLHTDIAQEGEDKFVFEIVTQVSTKGDLSWQEIRTQVESDVLCATDEKGERLYYNGNISAIRFIPPNKHMEKL